MRDANFGPDELANAQLASIVASSDDVIVSKTLDGVITSWNPAAMLTWHDDNHLDQLRRALEGKAREHRKH